jgi:hypothetical protein
MKQAARKSGMPCRADFRVSWYLCNEWRKQAAAARGSSVNHMRSYYRIGALELKSKIDIDSLIGIC